MFRVVALQFVSDASARGSRYNQKCGHANARVREMHVLRLAGVHLLLLEDAW
jgi:hypothetical protein